MDIDGITLDNTDDYPNSNGYILIGEEGPESSHIISIYGNDWRVRIGGPMPVNMGVYDNKAIYVTVEAGEWDCWLHPNWRGIQRRFGPGTYQLADHELGNELSSVSPVV